MTTETLQSGSITPAGEEAPTSRRAVTVAWHLAIFALFVLVAVLMTWPLATDLRHRLISWGDPVFQAWTMAWDVHAWTTNPLSVFDANVFYPYRNTLAYSDHLFGQALLMFPLLLFEGNVLLADNLSVLLAFALSAFGMYWLVVDLTGNRWAGIVAGIAYAFAPSRMSHLEHLHLLSAQWLPLAVLAARRALMQRRWRWAGLLGAIVFLQGIFGLYYFFFCAVLLIFVIGSYLVGHRVRAMLGAILRIGVCCGIAAVLLLPTLLPYLQVHRELGIERGEAEVAQWSAKRTDYLSVHPRNRLWGDRLAPKHHRDLERDLFPGALVTVLAVVGLFNRRLGWERWMLLAVTLLSVLLSFGLILHIGRWEVPSPYRIFYDLMPGFRAIRVPARFGLLALVGLTGLAGLGVDLLLARLGHLIDRVRQLPRPRLAQAAAPLALTGALALVVVAEASTYVPLPDPLPATAAEAQRADYAWMAENPAPAIEFPMGEGLIASAWPNYWSTFHWNPVVNGYSGFAPPAYYLFRDRMNEFPSADTVRLLQGIGVRTVVYHADPDVAAADDPFLQRVREFPELTERLGPPDYVFELAPDPWMWELAEAIPAGQGVDLPELESDPALFGMLAAILQRTGHPVYGTGTVDFWEVPPPPADTCYVLLPDAAPTAGTPYAGATALKSAGGITLYQRAECAGP